MNRNLLWQHLFRAWKKHWPLQIASVTVMVLVLVILNFLFLGYSVFNKTVAQLGHGLEMVVYLKENAPQPNLDEIKKTATDSGDFDSITFTSKGEATARFLEALGSESLELLSDPKWKSPIPASFELRLADRFSAEQRIATLQNWNARFRSLGVVEDVFYGQGWVENFSRFLISARGLVLILWALSLGVGLLIVSNCIRLSFLQRKEEIEILELVGATSRFIRYPFLLEGFALGLLASILSLSLSYAGHSMLLDWLGQKWSFWFSLQDFHPLQHWYIGANLLTSAIFGGLGAWNCVRKINTGWSAVTT